MPGTKIINVLKDDRFEDILRLFQASPAQEIIFVMPPKSKFLNDEGHFTVLAAAAEEENKNILILSSNPDIVELSLKYNFGVLSNKNDKKHPKAQAVVRTDEPDEADEEELVSEEEQTEPTDTENEEDFERVSEDNKTIAESVYGAGREEEDDAGNFLARETTDIEEDPEDVGDNVSPREDYEIITAARVNRSLDDIVKPREDKRVNVRVSRKVEKPMEVELKKGIKESAAEDGIMDQIQSVWQSQKNSWSRPREARSFKIARIAKLDLTNKLVPFMGFVAVILLGIVVYVSTGSAQVIIKPKTDPLDLNISVSVSDSFQDIDAESKRIPGQLFSIDKNIEESFSSTGDRDVVQKSRGKITIYNEYGTTPQVLIATTRFESENGLIFRTLTTVTVPGTTVKNGEISPGKIQVEVIADKAGDAYNIPAGRFTIPAFKEKGDADRYQKFYGSSEAAFKGGIVGKAKVVTEQDYVDAKKKMEERIGAEIEQELKQQSAGLKILTPFKPVIDELTSDAKIDEATDSFTMTAKAKIQTVGFKEADLFQLISQYVEKMKNLAIIQEKLKLEFESIQFDKENNKLEFNVVIRGPAYGKIDQDRIIGDLMGKNNAEITSYIKSIDTVASARVLLSPFWVRRVPESKDRIKVVIDYN
ncbi:MAG: hypothetical protein HYT62_00705 [Candidatus Yanofskybacteria bacterium]|nr:hypothetical protein [Candidatus Yanofskybacteria bacterium]